jgi:phospho-N-acetylmuramoyl-pentapeptide-transferase
MLNWLDDVFGRYWGPLRLLSSFFFLSAVGFALTAVVTWAALPRLWKWLPRDRGRAFAVNAEQSVGKPVSAGLVFVSLFCVAALLFIPLSSACIRTLPFIVAAMLVGYVDDRRGGLSEYQLAVLDLAIALGVSCVMLGFANTNIWLPGWKPAIVLPWWLAIPLATGVIWLSINATNC